MPPPRFLIAALASPLSGSDGDVHLIPDGLFRAVDGRPAGLPGWKMDASIAADLLARIQGRKTRLAINYEHPEARGQPMPAAGWIDRGQIRYEVGLGLVAPVEWTARAKAHIDAGEYAYLSPVISYDPRTGAVRDLHLAGLTNTPALDSLAPLAALAERFDLALPEEEPAMNLAALRQALGLADDADEAAILAHATSLAESAAKVASLTEEVAALTAKTASDPSQFVPLAVHEETIAALRTAQAGNRAAEIDALLTEGLSAGKIPGKATAEWLRGLGVDALKTYLADAPTIAALTQTQTQGKAQEQKAALTAEQKQVCALMGIHETDYLKTLEGAQ